MAADPGEDIVVGSSPALGPAHHSGGHDMGQRIARLGFALVGASVMLALLASNSLAAGPVRTVFDLNDPSADADESAFATAFCGFEVQADISGRVTMLAYPGGDSRSVVQLNVYAIRVVYTNPANGNVVRLEDTGPDRFYVKDGRAYIAITGRSFNIGVVVIDLESSEIVHQAGQPNTVFDTLCGILAG